MLKAEARRSKAKRLEERQAPHERMNEELEQYIRMKKSGSLPLSSSVTPRLPRTQGSSTPSRKSSSRLKTILKPVLDLAKVLGELGYRQSLVNHDLKTLELRTRTESAWIKKAESAGRKADAEDFRKHSKYLVREHFLAQEELETLGRLEAEIQLVMNEKIDRLTKRLTA